MNKLQSEMNEIIIKKKDSFFEWFNRYYEIEDYWHKKTSRYIFRNITFNRCTDEWLRAIMFYEYEIYPFANGFLIKNFNDEFEDEKLTLEHANILHDYFISRFVVSLIVDDKVNVENLHSSSKYYQIYVKKQGYKKEEDIFDDKEVPVSDILLDVVTSGLVRHLLGVNFDEISSKINPNVRTFDMIWSYAWRLLYRLNSGQLESIDKYWKDLITGWKKCYIKDYYNGFHASTIVLLYYSYCQAINKQFKMEELIYQIMN